jgi:hypothetical protein
MFLRRIYANLLYSFKVHLLIILIILHLLLTIVEAPVFVQEEEGDIIKFRRFRKSRSSVVCSSVN